MELPIKLGRKPDHIPELAMSSPTSEPKEYFPSVDFEWDKPYNFPDEEFTMTVRARKVRTMDDKRTGKVREEVELLEITSVEGGKKKKKSSHDEAGDAIDKLREEKESDY